jgi:hypothetical protein
MYRIFYKKKNVFLKNQKLFSRPNRIDSWGSPRILHRCSSRNPRGDNSWGSPKNYHGWAKNLNPQKKDPKVLLKIVV